MHLAASRGLDKFYRRLEFPAVPGAPHDDAALLTSTLFHDELLDRAKLTVGPVSVVASLDAERNDVRVGRAHARSLLRIHDVLRRRASRLLACGREKLRHPPFAA